MTPTIDIVVHRIRQFRILSGYKKFRLATMAGVPEVCTRNIDDDAWDPKISTVRKLEKVVPADFIAPDLTKIPDYSDSNIKEDSE